MRMIGLIGGMSWESTALYYRAINEGVRNALGGNRSAPLLLHSFDFEPIKAMQEQGEWAAMAQLLGDAAAGLERGGAQAVLICTNTMHKLADQVQARLGVPLLHLADCTADALIAAGHERVGLLGTRFTMTQQFYRGRLAARGIEVVVPEDNEVPELNRVIYDELCLGIVRDESRDRYRRTIERLGDAGAQALILGCTELGMLVRPGDTRLPLFDTTAIHAAAAVHFMLAGRPATHSP